MKKIVFLYTEIAGYTIACLKALAIDNTYSIHLIRYNINNEAPFSFDIPNNIRVYNKNSFNKIELIHLVQKINPDLIYVSGWIDKDYLQVIKKIKNKKIILGLDNPWENSIKQKIKSLLFKFTYKKYYTYCFIAGQPQESFAIALGFKTKNIYTGVYACDTLKFKNYYTTAKSRQHNLIYIGRYVAQKNIDMLWQAFIEVVTEHKLNNNLICIGTGNITPVIHKQIQHVGFVQPNDLAMYLQQANVFILPSLIEPWGVVVHEMACAGYPILLSKNVGAHTQYLTKDNGLLFDPNNIHALKEAIYTALMWSNDKIYKMSEASHNIGNSYTTQDWSNKIKTMLLD